MGPTESGDRHAASLWKPADRGAVDCYLCEHRCHVALGQRGVCGVRENLDGELVTRVYGRLIARHVDPIEKKPLFHFLPGSRSYSVATVGCNFQCGFCQNWEISQYPRAAEGETPGDVVPPEDVVAAAERQGCASISYTYTEPTIFYEYARDVALPARKAGLKNIFVTNGFMTPEAIDDMAAWLDAANVDLKSWQDDFYRRVCKGRLEPVKASIRRLHEAGVHVEVTTLLVTGRNDAADDLKGIAGFLAELSSDMPWHVSRYHPDFEMTEPPPTPEAKIEAALAIGRAAGLRYVYAGNVAGSQDTLCPSCGALAIERRGFDTRMVSFRGGACGQCHAAIPIITD
jgi:pyruvate formate lyase activating enzyme